MRIPSTPGSPMVLRQRVTLRIFAAARTRSLLLMILVTAAATSGMIAPCRRLRSASLSCKIQDVFAEFADGHTLDRAKGFLVEGLQDEPADIVVGGIDQRLRDNLMQRQIGKSPLCRNAFPFRACSQARQLIARLLLIRFGKQLAEVGKDKLLGHERAHSRENECRNCIPRGSELQSRSRRAPRLDWL